MSTCIMACAVQWTQKRLSYAPCYCISPACGDQQQRMICCRDHARAGDRVNLWRHHNLCWQLKSQLHHVPACHCRNKSNGVPQPLVFCPRHCNFKRQNAGCVTGSARIHIYCLSGLMLLEEERLGPAGLSASIHSTCQACHMPEKL